MRKKELPEIMNLTEFMSYLRIGYSTAIQLLESGKIPSLHWNHEWRIYKQDVIDYIRRGNCISTKKEVSQ